MSSTHWVRINEKWTPLIHTRTYNPVSLQSSTCMAKLRNWASIIIEDSWNFSSPTYLIYSTSSKVAPEKCGTQCDSHRHHWVGLRKPWWAVAKVRVAVAAIAVSICHVDVYTSGFLWNGSAECACPRNHFRFYEQEEKVTVNAVRHDDSITQEIELYIKHDNWLPC